MATQYPITAVAPTVASALGLRPPRAAAEPPIPEIVADLAGLERVAVLAVDAMGLSVWQHWRAQMPYLTSLHEAHHTVLRSVSPPITPVNFAALVTGAPLEVHKIGDRFAPLACESLFDVVREAGGFSLGAGQPTYTGGEFLARYSDLPGRVPRPGDAAVEELLMETVPARLPRYLIVQFGDTDTCFHQVGPTSPEAEAVVREADARVQRVATMLLGHDYGVIVLADHGQHDVPLPGAKDRVHGGHDGSGGEQDFLVACTWARPA